MTDSTIDKLTAGQTVYVKHPTDEVVAMIVPNTDYTAVKWKRDGEEYTVKDTTDLATDMRMLGEEITEAEYLQYGK